MMTEQERETLTALGGAWNSFTQLEHSNADDFGEFRHGIHVLQYIIMARIARRTDIDFFNQLEQ